MSNSKKIVKSAIFGQLPIVLQIFSGFVIMPLLIRYFGDKQYGLWVVVGTFLGYFGLLDLGFSKTIVRYVSRAIGKKDKDESNKWITVGLFLLSSMSILGILILLLSVWGFKYFITEDLVLMQTVFLLGGGAFLLAMPSRIFTGVLQAHIRGDILAKINTIIGLFRIIMFLIALYLEFSFIGFIVISAIFTIIEALTIVIYALKEHKGYAISREGITYDNLKSFLDYSGFSFIAQVADLLRFNAYPIIITSFLGLSAITPFQIANRLQTTLGQFHNRILISFTPVFSQIEGKYGIGDKLRETYLFSHKISSYLVTFTIGMTAIIASDFISVWMGDSYNDATTLLLIGLVGNLAAGIQIPVVCYLFGTSKHRFYAISNSIEAALIIISALVLVNQFGLVGMVTGASLSTFFVKTFIQPLWVSRDLNISIYELYIKNTLLNFIKVIIFLILPFIIAKLFLSPNYYKIIALLVFSSILYIPYIWHVGFSKEERNKLFNSLPFLGRVSFIKKILR